MKSLIGFILFCFGAFFMFASLSLEIDEEKKGATTTPWPLVFMLIGLLLLIFGFWLITGEYYVKPEI